MHASWWVAGLSCSWLARSAQGLCICYSKCISWHFSLAGYRIDYCVASPSCAPPLSLPSNPARMLRLFRFHSHASQQTKVSEPLCLRFFSIKWPWLRCIYFMHAAYYCLHGACECATIFFFCRRACECPMVTTMALVIYQNSNNLQYIWITTISK